MIYNILGILIGILALTNTISLFISKKENKKICILNLVLALGFIGIGIGGFFMPKNLEYITIILLLLIAVIFLIQYSLFLKKSQTPKKHKRGSCN